MIHPDQVAEMLYPQAAAAAATSTPGSIPTVVSTPTHYQLSSETGHRTLWVTFAIMVVSAGVFALLSWNVPVSKRVHHVLTTLIPLAQALAYFAMASAHASTLVCHRVRDHDHDTFHDECRQLFWARYVGWALATPLVLWNLCLLAGVDGAHTLMALVANLVMVLSGMFAAIGAEHTAQKWGWFVIACLGYVFAVWHVGLHGNRTAANRGAKVMRLWWSLAVYVLALWAAYAIVWGVATLGRRTTVDTEILIYAILDILAGPIFGLWLLISHRALAETTIDLGGYWSQGLAAEGRIRVGDED
ncbi:hypothetical protein VTK26DRAFT_5657 [Humicola hyalothermophila]